MVSMETRHPFEILTETGFIGSGSGPDDLSMRYKEELRKLLATKHGEGAGGGDPEDFPPAVADVSASAEDDRAGPEDLSLAARE